MSTEHKLKSLNKLESEIDARIKEFNKKRYNNQKYSKTCSLMQLILASTTTLLIAINTALSLFWISVIAIITNCIASISGQILSKYMYQERMKMNISTICDLYELKFLITMDKKMEEDDESKEITLERVQEYKKKYQDILNIANEKWQSNFIVSELKEK